MCDGEQVSLTLPDDTVSQDADDERTPGNLTRRGAHQAKTLTNFWKHWKRELREFHHTGQQEESSSSLQTDEVVTVR